MYCKLSTLLALAGLSSAHFVLNWPYTAGFDDDNEPNAPCGGATVTVDSNSPQINVDRFAVSILVAHPTGNFGFYATTDTSAPYTFTQISQNITSEAIGTFCATYLSVPESFAGKAGVLQVIDTSIDGVLYQCAPVNFVSGANNTIGQTCSNSTGESLTWTGPAPAAFSGNSSSNSTSSSASIATVSSTSTMTSGTATAVTTTTKAGAAAMMTLAAAPVLGGLGVIAAGMVL